MTVEAAPEPFCDLHGSFSTPRGVEETPSGLVALRLQMQGQTQTVKLVLNRSRSIQFDSRDTSSNRPLLTSVQHHEDLHAPILLEQGTF